MNLTINNISVPKTARNKRIYPNGSTSSSSSNSSGSVDLSNLLKLVGMLEQTVEGDLILNGNLYAQGDIVAFSSIPGISSSWWDALPKASNTTLGGIKVGANLSIDSSGVLSAQTGGLTSVDWSIIQNKPSTFPASTHTHSYSSLTGLPSLFDGNYNSLSNRPDLSVYQQASTAWNTGNLNNPIRTGNYINSAGQADAQRNNTIFSYSSAGTPFSGTLLSVGGFNDGSYALQLNGNYGGNRLAFRNLNNDGGGGWEGWKEIIHSGNYLQYKGYQLTSPNGASVVQADYAMPDAGHSFIHSLAMGPDGNDGHILGMTWSNTTSSYGAQLWIDTDPTNRMAIRSRSGAGVWNVWSEVYTSANLNRIDKNFEGYEIYSANWFRNRYSGTGLYNEANATGIYSDAVGQMRIYNNGKLRVDNWIDAYGSINLHNTSLSYANQVHLQDNGNGSIELATYAGSLPGYGSNYYPTLKSSGSIHFAASGSYVGAITSSGIEATYSKQFKNYGNGYKSFNYTGLVGDYDQNSTASKIIWTIGDQWNSLSTHYGLGYQFYSDFGHTYVVRENGNVNIKFSGTYGHIWGAGSLTMGGDITAYSDAKLKTDLQPITNALDKIQNIRGYYYKRIDTQDNKQHLGLIAQEVQKQYPELVNETNDTLSLNYQNFTAVLLEAIKDLSNKVKELERRVK